MKLNPFLRNNDLIIDDMENIAGKGKENIFWKPPDKRAEARFNRTLENPW